MPKENSVLISALILIIVIGFVGVTYSQITGESIRPPVRVNTSSILVDPTVVDSGGQITVTAAPGCTSLGFRADAFSIKDAQGVRRDTFIFPGAYIRGQPETKVVSISPSLNPGLYQVTALDDCTGKVVTSNYFRIRG